MTNTIRLLVLAAAGLVIAACDPESLPTEPVAEGLPQNESRSEESQRVAEGVSREDRERESDTATERGAGAQEQPDTPPQ